MSWCKTELHSLDLNRIVAYKKKKICTEWIEIVCELILVGRRPVGCAEEAGGSEGKRKGKERKM